MIIFEDISFRNFLSTGNIPTVIQLNKCITTIMTGKNGGGKSTFEDALVYNLFGKPFRKVKLGQLINKVNEKELVTECNFTIGHKRYKVIRGQKPTVFEIWVDGVMIPQPAESKDYQHILENDILKLNYKTFTQIIILGSASFVPFMQLPLANRREIIENILDISVFSDMNEILKDKIKDLDKELEDIKHKIELANNNYKLKYDFFQSMSRDNEKRIEEYNDKIGELKKTILQSVLRKEALEKEIIEIQSLIDEFGDVEKQKSESSKRMVDTEKVISSKSYHIRTCSDSNVRHTELQTTIDTNERELNISRAELSNLNSAIVQLKEEISVFDGIDDRKREAERVITISTQVISDSKRRIKFFTDNNDCPECGRHIDGEFESSSVEKYQADIKKAEDDISANTVIIEDINKKQKERSDLQAEVLKYDKQATALDQKIRMMEKALSTAYKSQKDITFTTPEEFQALNDEVDKLKFDLTFLTTEVDDYSKKVTQLTECKERLAKCKSGILLCDQIISSSEKTIVEHNADIEKITNQPPSEVTQEMLDALIVEIKELDAELSKKKYIFHYYGVVKKLLKDDGIKTNIISQYLPIINATINMYLDKMDFPINFMFDDNFNEVIQSNYRDDFSYHSFSEGEKARIDLALLFTWRDIALKKSRNAANILIFDEIFDGSLDADGVENFMEILGINKDGFSTFVISHKDETINARFDRNLFFTKDGHFSAMEEK